MFVRGLGMPADGRRPVLFPNLCLFFVSQLLPYFIQKKNRNL
jgi:hypothetical protein